jgi:hypothetical protein
VKLKLLRTIYSADGIFGQLCDEAGNLICSTLEHSYSDGYGGFGSKIPLGTFQCIRGLHELHGMTKPFSTFEVTGVKGHKGILFHTGNRNADSEGCILLGLAIIRGGSFRELTGSVLAFNKFSELVKGLDSFTLEVVNK